jgi:hypothetical protein
VQLLAGEAYGAQDEAWLRQPAGVLKDQVVKIGKRNYYKFF